jgi:hypothetical protein
MRKEFFGFDFEIDSKIENDKKVLDLIPNPEAVNFYQRSLQVLDENSVNLLWSKSYFGINHSTQLLQVMYDTFESKVDDINNFNDVLTIHALFCDMVFRYGAIIEDFAGFCSACRRHVSEGTNIADHFVAFSNPNQFYTDVLSPQGDIQIRQIFRLPLIKDDLDLIFSNLSSTEKDLLWKGVTVTTVIISERMKLIAQSIVRDQATSFTYFDLYNKLKHGFSPYYSYIFPSPIRLESSNLLITEEEMVESYLVKSMLLMHNKLRGQMSDIEKQRLRDLKLGSCATTLIEPTKESAVELKNTVIEIDYLYKNLVNRFIAYATGSKKIQLLGSDDYFTQEESTAITNIINDDNRYI